MSLSLFDIVGPFMMGPSSSHTAGAARIGYMARLILGREPERVTLYFHPVLMQTYAGHRTHAALVAGLLGYREGDPAGIYALEIAMAKGIAVNVEQIDSPHVHQNTMRIKAETGATVVVINGISVGGGSILISEIDGVPVALDGNTYALLLRAPAPADETIKAILAPYKVVGFSEGRVGPNHLACWALRQEVPAKVLAAVQAEVPSASLHLIPPLYRFRQVSDEPVLFCTFSELLDLTQQGMSLPQVALSYEERRSEKSEESVRDGMCEILSVMRAAVEEGLSGQVKLLGGFCPGDDGWRLMQAAQQGKTITSGIFTAALARALAVVELNGAMGRVVAAPTAGSAGVLPGVLFSVGEYLKKSEADLIDALLVADVVGICIANKASLSGAVGGCQGEVGVAAAMAASAATFLGGGDAEACIHAAALTLKNILGLICDPAAGPVEVPCIKRNAMGAAIALMGAELALAGIRSYIPPDEVVDALVNVQKLLPQELKGSTVGGLGCTRTAERMRSEWQQKLSPTSALRALEPLRHLCSLSNYVTILRPYLNRFNHSQ
ncbi:MAG: L-serine ammonia-lyase, iron-sulfur-dependent, subunit alpha [Firmicutes bacterium]|nr:L-serine ammonia-lyase, iron-sulfur-dependent, subunit alpha [Bacillota bacterium]